MKEDRNQIPHKGNRDVTISWHALSAEEVLEELDTGIQTGLTSGEVAARLEEFGPNQLSEKPRAGFVKMVIDQLRSFVVILLIVAAFVSLILGEYIDAGAIFAIVVLNAILGVVQEGRAEAALAAL